ncbi:MAG TPA: hypothetical protein VKY89_15985 [Thermoanaerobaculia bacterium]|nr:hypothetical protein [Thermoanaerobaculia bacterium]
MNLITLDPPALDRERRTASFRWRVEPATALYRRTSFTLAFPPEVDFARVPPALWWTVALLCLHPQWNLLRPCRVELPVELPPGEAEFWSRLLDAEAATLEAYRGDRPAAPPWLPLAAFELRARGPALPPLPSLPAGRRCAAAFSGGKDSLLQAALLCDFTPRPLLVATTSPMPPLHDHLTDRRRQVLAAMAARRDVTLLEVESDLRAAWKNDFPPLVGYPVAVNEITDTFLYLAALLVCAVALGATRLFLASEAEVQENVELDGRIVQHPHCMYSRATQLAVEALLAPLGLRYGSLITPLHSEQVQQLLWTRYTDLCDLQYSCWRVGEHEAACSRCAQCLRLALSVLALGGRPDRMGIDLATLLPALAEWQPRQRANGALPDAIVAAGLHAQVARALAATPPGRVLAALAAAGPARLLRPGAWRALAAYRRLRRRLAATAGAAPAPGYRPAFLRGLEPSLAGPVGAVFAEHFAPATANGVLERGERLARFVAAPLLAGRLRPEPREPTPSSARPAP